MEKEPIRSSSVKMTKKELKEKVEEALANYIYELAETHREQIDKMEKYGPRGGFCASMINGWVEIYGENSTSINRALELFCEKVKKETTERTFGTIRYWRKGNGYNYSIPAVPSFLSHKIHIKYDELINQIINNKS